MSLAVCARSASGSLAIAAAGATGWMRPPRSGRLVDPGARAARAGGSGRVAEDAAEPVDEHQHAECPLRRAAWRVRRTHATGERSTTVIVSSFGRSRSTFASATHGSASTRRATAPVSTNEQRRPLLDAGGGLDRGAAVARSSPHVDRAHRQERRLHDQPGDADRRCDRDRGRAGSATAADPRRGSPRPARSRIRRVHRIEIQGVPVEHPARLEPGLVPRPRSRSRSRASARRLRARRRLAARRRRLPDAPPPRGRRGRRRRPASQWLRRSGPPPRGRAASRSSSSASSWVATSACGSSAPGGGGGSE